MLRSRLKLAPGARGGDAAGLEPRLVLVLESVLRASELEVGICASSLEEPPVVKILRNDLGGRWENEHTNESLVFP